MSRREDEIADFLMKRICYRVDDYAIQLQSGAYSRQGLQLTRHDILAHIRGEYTLGVYQSTYPEELCKWVVYDIDGPRRPGSDLATSGIQQTLLKNILTENGVPFYTEDSGSPGSVHIWVFFEHPTPLYLAYNWARAVVVRGGHYMFNSEIFPKQAILNPEKPYGNLVKVPFGIHQKSGRRTYFYKGESEPDISILDSVETIDISSWQPVDLPANERGEKTVYDRNDRNVSNSKVSGYKTNSCNKVGLYRYASGIRPCIQHMIKTKMQLTDEDGHMLRIAIASELLQSGMTVEEVVESFRTQWNFNYDGAEYQVRSVLGYNRPTCDRIRWHARNLFRIGHKTDENQNSETVLHQRESGFNIDDMCRECIFYETPHPSGNGPC